MLNARTLFAVSLLLLAAGCATPSQSPEEKHREARIKARERGWSSPTPLFAETPTPTATPHPTPTPRPVLGYYGDAIVGPDKKVIDDLVAKVGAFKETCQVGAQTARIALSNVVLVLQEQRRAFMAIAPPPDFASAQRAAANAMKYDINLLLDFMGEREGGTLSSEMMTGMIAESAWDGWTDNFNFAVEARRAAARSSPTPTARAVPTPRRKR
jgi:hypothetical protein